MNGVIANFAEAYLQPRNSAVRILRLAQGWPTVLLLGALAFSLQSLLTGLTEAALGLGEVREFGEESQSPQAMSPVTVILLLFVFVGSVLGIGKLFGGSASLRDVVAVLAWFGIVTSVLVPIEILWIREFQSERGATPLIAVGVGLEFYALWILANFIAAAHAFRSAFFVLLGIVAFLLLFMFLLLPFVLQGV